MVFAVLGEFLGEFRRRGPRNPESNLARKLPNNKEQTSPFWKGLWSSKPKTLRPTNPHKPHKPRKPRKPRKLGKRVNRVNPIDPHRPPLILESLRIRPSLRRGRHWRWSPSTPLWEAAGPLLIQTPAYGSGFPDSRSLQGRFRV